MKRRHFSSKYFSSYSLRTFLWMSAFILNSCGALGPLDRDYEFALVSPSQAVRAEIKECFQQINQITGIEMVHVTSEHNTTAGLSDKQSQAHIIPGVQYADSDGKMRIAQAQYLIHGSKGSTTMKVQFDWNSFTKNSAQPGQGISAYNLRTCAHEISHGAGREHINDPTRIMNPTITNLVNNLTWPSYRDDLAKAFRADSPADI